ncbi:MAG: tRNA 2-thiouridine(34) synthase MnmA [Campylobacterota bacterium]
MKVGVLLSGGVDSTYSAYLLKSMGYEVIGFYLRLHHNEQMHKDAMLKLEKIAKHLKIETRVLDLQQEFEDEVYNYFINAYKEGITPNPCAVCNPKIKFGLAFDAIIQAGCQKIATGHYAQIENGMIKEAFDTGKDQSYFLFGLKKSVIEKLLFPLGGLLKEDVKPLAFKAMPWLGNLQEYKESQDVCFVEKNYTDTLRKHFEINQQGIVEDLEGNVIGRHEGYMHYTVGKRKGLDIQLASKPHYVVAIDAKNNRLTAAGREALATTVFTAQNVSLHKDFIDGFYQIKARYNSDKTTAYVQKEGSLVNIELEYPVDAVAKGQAAVVYKNNTVLGGGWIL